MHRRAIVTAMLVGACSHASQTSVPITGSTPASATQASNPCGQGGRCSITVSIPPDAVHLLKEYMVFNVFAGCPKALGFRQDGVQSPFSVQAPFQVSGASISLNTSMRRGKPIVQSSEQTVILPAMSGSIATVGIFYGAEPGKYAVVDFTSDPNQTAKFGYLLSGGTLIDDKLVDSQNRTIERKLCP